MRYIYITEDNIRNMVIESVRMLMTESSRGDKVKAWMTEIAKECGVQESDIKGLMDSFRSEIYHGTNLDDKYGWKYVPALFRMYVKNQITDKPRVNSIIKYIIDQCHINNTFIIDPDKFNENTVKEIGEKLDDMKRKEKEEGDNVETSGETDYDILSDVDFDTAKKYGNQSCPSSKLCYTQNENTWNSSNYGNNGANACYIMLKSGWEDLKPVHDNGSKGKDGDPYDTYGMSMIFLFVNPEGVLVASNTRWNHNANWGSKDCDKAFTPAKLSELAGKPFSQAFPANDKWRKECSDLQTRLYNGENIEDVFDKCGDKVKNGIVIVRMKSLYNVVNVNTKKILLDKWYSRIYYNVDDVVVCDPYNDWYRFNLIDNKGNFLIPNWATHISAIKFGMRFIITTDGKQWFMDMNNKFHKINDVLQKHLNSGVSYNGNTGDGYKLFREVIDFSDGLRIVVYETGSGVYYKNFINEQNQLLSEEWFAKIGDFHDGFCVVEDHESKHNYLGTDFKLLSNEWFDRAEMFEGDIACVEKNNERKLIDKNGNILDYTQYYQQKIDEGADFEQLFMYSYPDEKTGFIKVTTKFGENNFIDKNNKIISKQWYKKCSSFDKFGISKVSDLNEGETIYNFMRTDGTLLWNDAWFDYATDFYYGDSSMAMVSNYDRQYNLLKRDGNLLCDTWYDEIDDFNCGLARVRNEDGYYSYIKEKDGTLLRNEWFYRASEFSGGIATVEYDNSYDEYIIDTYGNISDPEYLEEEDEEYEEYD